MGCGASKSAQVVRGGSNGQGSLDLNIQPRPEIESENNRRQSASSEQELSIPGPGPASSGTTGRELAEVSVSGPLSAGAVGTHSVRASSSRLPSYSTTEDDAGNTGRPTDEATGCLAGCDATADGRSTDTSVSLVHAPVDLPAAELEAHQEPEAPVNAEPEEQTPPQQEPREGQPQSSGPRVAAQSDVDLPPSDDGKATEPEVELKQRTRKAAISKKTVTLGSPRKKKKLEKQLPQLKDTHPRKLPAGFGSMAEIQPPKKFFPSRAAQTPMPQGPASFTITGVTGSECAGGACLKGSPYVHVLTTWPITSIHLVYIIM